MFRDQVLKNPFGHVRFEQPHRAVLAVHGDRPLPLVAELVPLLPPPGFRLLVVLPNAVIELAGDAADYLRVAGIGVAEPSAGQAAEVGVLVEAEKVPVLPETARICAEYGIDPMGLIASGMLIMTAAPENVDAICRRLEAIDIDCTAIGTVTAGTAGRRLKTGGAVADLPYFSTDELTRAL